MSDYALLIDYQYCSGCRSCELACRNEHDFQGDLRGILVREEEPWQLPDGTWNWDYIPVPTALCDMCEDRIAAGKEPMCVQTCQAKSIEFGTPAELAERMVELGKKVVIFKP